MPASYRWADGDVEVSLAEVIGTDMWLLEIVTPVYGTFTAARQQLAIHAQEARQKVFGYIEVVDYSNVPVEDVSPARLLNDANGRVIFYEKYNDEADTNSYQYFGKLKEGFNPADMRWGGQLAIDAPKIALADIEIPVYRGPVEIVELTIGDDRGPILYVEVNNGEDITAAGDAIQKDSQEDAGTVDIDIDGDGTVSLR